MSLSNIFDPIVRAYFGGKGGSSGGSAVDDGYFLQWNFDTDGRDFIDLAAVLGANLYKISSAVLSAGQLIGSFVLYEDGNGGEVPSESVLSESGWVGVFFGPAPQVISGFAGTYNHSGINVTIPSNGTYILYDPDDLDMSFFATIYKPASA